MTGVDQGAIRVQVQPVAAGPALWAIVLILVLILACGMSMLWSMNSLRSDIHRLEREIRLLEAWAQKINATMISEGKQAPPGPLEGEQDAR